MVLFFPVFGKLNTQLEISAGLISSGGGKIKDFWTFSYRGTFDFEQSYLRDQVELEEKLGM